MAKDNCVICGKPVGFSNRQKLADGNVICQDCFKLAGYGITTNAGKLTLDDVQNNLANDPKSLARQEKQDAKDHGALEKFGVDLDSYADDELRRRNSDSARNIASALAGSKLYSFGSLLSGNTNETFLMEMARAQVEQNFILIRQNEEIIRLLKEK